MSFKALAWAVDALPGCAADKLVLFGLADRHNTEHDAAYPSIDWLVRFSSLNRKTVIAALDRLEESGFIADTGQRVGKTKQVKVYSLSIPKTEQYQKRNSSDFSPKQSQKRDTDTVKDTIPSRAKALSGSRAKISIEQALKDRTITADEATAWAVTEMRWPRGEAKIEWQRFLDSNSAHDRRYKDWKAAWRSWCRSPFCEAAKRNDDKTSYRREPLRG